MSVVIPARVFVKYMSNWLSLPQDPQSALAMLGGRPCPFWPCLAAFACGLSRGLSAGVTQFCRAPRSSVTNLPQNSTTAPNPNCPLPWGEKFVFLTWPGSKWPVDSQSSHNP